MKKDTSYIMCVQFVTLALVVKEYDFAFWCFMLLAVAHGLPLFIDCFRSRRSAVDEKSKLELSE